MKKTLTLFILIASTLLVVAQPPHDSNSSFTKKAKNSMVLDINRMTPNEIDRINQYIASQRDERGIVLATVGQAVASGIITSATSTVIDQMMKLTQLRKTQQQEWNRMIKNECRFEDSLSYIDNLTDFYSKGSFNGALDPADLNFNGFNLHTQHNGRDVLRFYCHVDTEESGIVEIFNHSKFRLVLDSMYFYPYHCHLPNFEANQIFVEEGKEYERNTQFSFEERSDLSVTISFTITSSWYNEALLLSKDVELGSFCVQVPIEKRHLTDSVFVYKRDRSGMPDINIAGDCFIVPRSYMPLTNGKAHWGTGEYNVKVCIDERCNASKSLQQHWRNDYRHLRRMRKEQNWQQFTTFCGQQGTTLLKVTLDKASSSVLSQWDFMQGAMGTGMNPRNAMGSSGTKNSLP